MVGFSAATNGSSSSPGSRYSGGIGFLVVCWNMYPELDGEFDDEEGGQPALTVSNVRLTSVVCGVGIRLDLKLSLNGWPIS